MRLYDLTTQYTDILSFLEDDADNESLQVMLDGLGGKIEEKVENTVKIIKSLESDSEGIDLEIKRLSSRKAALTNNIDYLRSNIHSNLNMLGAYKIKGNLFTVSLQNNPFRVIVAEDADLPSEYINVKTTFTPDKKKLKEAMDAGQAFEGVSLSQDQRLVIK